MLDFRSCPVNPDVITLKSGLRLKTPTLIAVLFTALCLTGCGTSSGNPRDKFQHLTGLDLSPSSTLNTAYDDHGGIFGDGETLLAFNTAPEIAKGIASRQPPWDQTDWKTCPVPNTIQSNCLNASRDFMNDENAVYAAVPKGPSRMPWHNGRLLVINVETNQIYLFCWDN